MNNQILNSEPESEEHKSERQAEDRGMLMQTLCYVCGNAVTEETTMAVSESPKDSIVVSVHAQCKLELEEKNNE